MDDSVRGVRQKESPVETEHNDRQQNGHNDFVYWFNGGHSSADRESSCQDGDSMTQDRPATPLVVERNN